MIQFEYCIDSFYSNMQNKSDILNKRGMNGWELVSVIYAKGNYTDGGTQIVYYWKREIKKEEE